MSEAMLSALEQDAINELMNLGIGNAANSLSQMIGQEIELDIPEVDFVERKELEATFQDLSTEKISAVLQEFTGDLPGNALLLFSEGSAKELVEIIMQGSVGIEKYQEMEKEVLSEIGNIVLNACFGSLADVLKCEVMGGLPEYERGTYKEVLDRATESLHSDLVMLLKVNFSLTKSEAGGAVNFIVGVGSINLFKQSIQRYLGVLH